MDELNNKPSFIKVVGKDVLARSPVMDPQIYSSGDVIKLLGIPQRAFFHWVEQGLVEPEARKADGRGSRRIFTSRNLLQIAILNDLNKWGLSIELMRSVMQGLETIGYFKNIHNKDRAHEVARVEITPEGDISLKNGKQGDTSRSTFLQIGLPELERRVTEIVRETAYSV